MSDDDDRAAVAGLVRTFFAAFVSGAESFDELRAALLPEALIIRAGGGEPAVYDVGSFIAPRRELLTGGRLTGGRLTGFREWELDGRTEVFGAVAWDDERDGLAVHPGSASA